MILTVLRLILLGFALFFTATGRAQDADLDQFIDADSADSQLAVLRDQARAHEPATGDSRMFAGFFHRRGWARHQLGQYSAAVADLQTALTHAQPRAPAGPDGWGGRAAIYGLLGFTFERQGDWFSFRDLWRQIAREYSGTNVYMYHWAQLRLMRVNGQLGYRAEEEAARKEAEALLAQIRRGGIASVSSLEALRMSALHNGERLREIGQHARAEPLLRESLEWAERVLERRRKTHLDSSRLVRAAIGNLRSAEFSLANALSAQGKFGEAEIHARSGLRRTVALHGSVGTPVSTSLNAVGRARFQQGDIATASRYYRAALRALEGADVAPYSTSLAARRAAVADIHVVEGQWSQGLELFSERDRGLRSNAAQLERIDSDHPSWAYALHRTGQGERSIAMAQRLVARQLRGPSPGGWDLALRRGVLAAALAGVGRNAEALSAFRESIDDLSRRSPGSAGVQNMGYWSVFWQRRILQDYLDLLAQLQSAGRPVDAPSLVDESFRVGDAARRSFVQGAIEATAVRATLPDGALRELARREQDNIARIAALDQLLSRLAGAPVDERLPKVIRDMTGEIDRLRKEHGELVVEMRARFPEYAELINPRPVGVADVAKALAPNEALVSIYLGDERIYVWTIGTGGTTTFRVAPMFRRELEAKVALLRRALDFGDGNLARLPTFDVAVAYELYDALLAPDAGLWRSATVLNVVPHGALAHLPFGLLVTARSQQPGAGPQARYQQVAWLAKQVAIAQLPSVTAFAALRRAPAPSPNRTAFLGFGDPVFGSAAQPGGASPVVRNLARGKSVVETDAQLEAALRSGAGAVPNALGLASTLARGFDRLGALPETADELREIAQALKADARQDVRLGAEATERNVKRMKLDDRKVIAFATHGLAPGELFGLDQPALVLSNPALTGDTDEDGFLTLEEVLALKLDADWVILSACNTASADGRGSEAVSGLGRAFFYAGARSLLVSNWAVETHSARLLTTEIFRRQAADPTLTRAQALRESMLSLMQRTAAGEQAYSYAHPAFWAPFSLIGDGR